ncbi:MAG: hypothetical protein BGO31_09230 [Bacteroidetes bacterium 43-16]|nr:MAG: hypothetical protein BGO31_09230 [Bacteroidetes bacterium 43-16]
MKQKILHIRKLFFLCALLLFTGSSVIWGQTSLPVNRTSNWNNAATGWTNNGVTHRTTSFACTGSSAAIFDNTNDRLTVNFNAAPDKLVFTLKGANMAGNSTMLVERSDNGSSWSTLGEYGTASGDIAIGDCDDISINLTATTRYVRWTYTKSVGNCDLDDVRITQAVNCPTPSFSTQPANASRLVGNTATFNAAAGNTTSYQWQWRANSSATWANVSAAQGTGGTTSAFTTVAATQAMNGYQYRVIATNACGGSSITSTANSNTAILTVTCPATPVLTTQPASTTVDLGTAAFFEIAATNVSTYKWQVWSSDIGSWVDIGTTANGYSGQTTNTLTVSTPDMNRNNGRYRAVVANLCNQTTTSNEAVLTIDAGIVVNTNPASVLGTDHLTSITTYTNTGVGQILSEGIRYSTDGLTWSLLISGGQATGLLANTQYYYQAYATFDVGTFYGASLDTFTLAMIPGTPLLDAPAGGTTIDFVIDENGNPVSTSYAIASGTDWVQADGTLGTNPVWQTETLWGTVSVNGLMPQTNYCFAVKARNNDAIETVLGTQDCIQTSCPAIAITTQVQDQMLAEGGTASFEVIATGSNLVYEWQENNGSGWQTVTGNAHQFTTAPVDAAMDGYLYKVIIRDNCSNVLSSDTARLYVIYHPVIIVHPEDSLAVAAGQTATFNVSAQGNSLSYQWELSTDDGFSWNIVSGATAASYAIVADDNMNGHQYRVQVSNSEGAVVSDAGAINVVVPTPVTLLRFDAVKEQDKVVLKWATASEANNKEFIVERSRNGMEWDGILSVKSQSPDGNSNILKQYEVKDESPLKGLNVYRLKQVDRDGVFSLSSVRKIQVEDNDAILIYPNPAQDRFTILGTDLIEQVRIINVNGQLLKTIAAAAEINISDLAAGIYTVQIITKDNKVTERKLMIAK